MAPRLPSALLLLLLVAGALACLPGQPCPSYQAWRPLSGPLAQALRGYHSLELSFYGRNRLEKKSSHIQVRPNHQPTGRQGMGLHRTQCQPDGWASDSRMEQDGHLGKVLANRLPLQL